MLELVSGWWLHMASHGNRSDFNGWKDGTPDLQNMAIIGPLELDI